MKTLKHASNRGVIVATFRYGYNMHIRASYIKGEYWFHVRLDKKNCLKCDCGGFIKKYTDDDLRLDDKNTCAHIVALYKAFVTLDAKDRSGDYSVSTDMFRSMRSRPFAKLTAVGERMFFWRWTAKALEAS